MINSLCLTITLMINVCIVSTVLALLSKGASVRDAFFSAQAGHVFTEFQGSGSIPPAESGMRQQASRRKSKRALVGILVPTFLLTHLSRSDCAFARSLCFFNKQELG